MSEFMREAVPIIFMYLCVLGLGPFIAIAMWMAFDGDRLREDVGDEVVATEPEQHDGATAQLRTEASPAA